MKTPFISRERLAELTAQFPTPFHLYDEKGIRARARDDSAEAVVDRGVVGEIVCLVVVHDLGDLIDHGVDIGTGETLSQGNEIAQQVE